MIALIRRSPTVDDARQGLIRLLEIDEIQATAILDMQLRRLAALERQRIVDRLAATGSLARSHLLPAVRAELLARLDRRAEARGAYLEAAERCGNAAERVVLEAKAARLEAAAGPGTTDPHA